MKGSKLVDRAGKGVHCATVQGLNPTCRTVIDRNRDDDRGARDRRPNRGGDSESFT